MNALRQAPRFATHIDGYHTEPCNDNGWTVQFAYHIEQRGRPGHPYTRGDGIDYDFGRPTLVKVIGASLIGPNKTPGVELPLTHFTTDRLAEVAQIIGDDLDTRE